MRKLVYGASLFASLFFCFSAQSSTAVSSEQFCSMDRSSFIQDFFQAPSRLGFQNPAGDLNMGLCWWHSQFQRLSVYLAVFRPELPKPTNEQASRFIHQIIKKESVVEIPGYTDMLSFSLDYQNEITKQLSKWQLEDGFIKQSWILDLWLGEDKTSADILQKKVDAVYRDFSENHVVPFVRIKLGPIVAHALLIIDMKPVDNGYEMQVIDSNYPAGTETVTYQNGDTSLSLGEDGIGEFVPTLGSDGDFGKITTAIRRYCNGSSPF